MTAVVDTPIGELRQMDSSGDTQVTWRQDDEVGIGIARAAFAEAQNKRASVFVQKPGHSVHPIGTRLTEFDPTVEQMVVVPAYQGG